MNTKCQVFTPYNYIEELLNSVGYTKNLFEKRVLENSCGDGNILAVIVDRYIDDCRINGYTDVQIREGLSRDIYGVEIDPEQYEKCINNLNDLVDRKGIDKVNWNIENTDYLRWIEPVKFQYVIGNPPYITYQELNEKQRNHIRNNFVTCKNGKFDYCYAFIEKSLKCLADDGKMSYLIPSSIFKTVFGENLRNYIKPYIQEIRDYTRENMFANVLVKSAIMVLSMKKKDKVLKYYDMTNRENVNINIENLTKKWFFSTNNKSGTRRFGDYFQVAHVVATLLNEAFVIREECIKEDDNNYICDGYFIEKKIVRETATPRTLRYKKAEKI